MLFFKDCLSNNMIFNGSTIQVLSISHPVLSMMEINGHLLLQPRASEIGLPAVQHCCGVSDAEFRNYRICVQFFEPLNDLLEVRCTCV